MQLPGVQGLLDQSRVVGGADHLDAVRSGEVRIVADVLPDELVGESSGVKRRLNVCHRGCSLSRITAFVP